MLGWVMCVIISFIFEEETVSILTPFFDDLGGGRINHYLSMMDEFEAVWGVRRFRIDFILYSLAPILLGGYYIYKGFRDEFYNRLLNAYIITNFTWILFFMYMPYTSRYAYLSWCLMPIIMIYPLLKEEMLIKNQNRFAGLLISGNLILTMFVVSH